MSTTKKSTKKASAKKQGKKKYVSVLKRPYKNETEFSSIISKHASHNPNASAVRGKENARLRESMKQGKASTKEISLNLFVSLFSGKTDYSKKSNFDRVLCQILAILIKKGYNKKGIFSFPYKARDTKQGNIISLARRVRTACKALYINKEKDKMNVSEIHKISAVASKKEISALRFSDQYIK